MSYVLEGREVPETPPDRCVGQAPCIFCDKLIGHLNDDGGTGWLLGALVGGEPKWYLYCNALPCADSDDIWRCGCEPDFVENVGERCHCCLCHREDAVPVSG